MLKLLFAFMLLLVLFCMRKQQTSNEIAVVTFSLEDFICDIIEALAVSLIVAYLLN